MKIMIDIDRVIFDCPSVLASLGNLIFRDTNEGRKLSYKEISADTTMDYFNLMFFSKLSHKENFKEVENSIDIIKKWQSQGHEIEFVSSRPNIKSFYKPIIAWLKEKGVNFSNIKIACTNKAIYCKLNHFDVMIDDSLKNCENSSRLGVHSIWLKTKYNKNTNPDTIPQSVLHANSWSNIDNYIQSLQKTKGRIM